MLICAESWVRIQRKLTGKALIHLQLVAVILSAVCIGNKGKSYDLFAVKEPLSLISLGLKIPGQVTIIFAGA
jgi:hypothetical protein